MAAELLDPGSHRPGRRVRRRLAGHQVQLRIFGSVGHKGLEDTLDLAGRRRCLCDGHTVVALTVVPSCEVHKHCIQDFLPRRGTWAYGPDVHTPVDAARALEWDGPEDPGDWRPVTRTFRDQNRSPLVREHRQLVLYVLLCALCCGKVPIVIIVSGRPLSPNPFLHDSHPKQILFEAFSLIIEISLHLSNLEVQYDNFPLPQYTHQTAYGLPDNPSVRPRKHLKRRSYN